MICVICLGNTTEQAEQTEQDGTDCVFKRTGFLRSPSFFCLVVISCFVTSDTINEVTIVITFLVFYLHSIFTYSKENLMEVPLSLIDIT